MQLLNLQNVTKNFGERCLFSDVSFSVESGRKIGVVGANGTGKTTLFKMLTGQEDCDGGSIVFSKETTLGYMDQHLNSTDDSTAYDYVVGVFSHLIALEREIDELNDRLLTTSDAALIAKQHELSERFAADGGLTYKSRTSAALSGLGFTQSEYSRPLSSFSGGQRSKLGLARMLLSGANLLLLDEPTNHLDISAVEWLEGFLAAYNGSFMVVTHDRFFLDRVTDATLEIENGKITYFGEKYSRYKEVKQLREQSLQNEYDEKLKEIHRLEGIVEQQRRWNREKNIRTAESKLKVIDKIKDSLEIPPSQLKTVSFSFECENKGPTEILNAYDLSLSFGNTTLFSSVQLNVRRGEKVFLIGPNGCGKTSLLRILCGEYSPTAGNYSYGPGVKYSYFDQIQSSLNPEKTALDEVWDKALHMNEAHLRSAFASFLFKGDDVFKRISELSGGERARVQLLELMLSGANLLILDEPTNHLDISSKEAVEEALASFDGTVIAVSHDRYFINRLADRIYAFRDGTLVEYKGGYEEYLLARETLEQESIEDRRSGSSQGAKEYRRNKEEASRLRRMKTRCQRCEAELDELSRKREQLEKELSSPENASDYQLLEQLSSELHECEEIELMLLDEWENLQNELQKVDEN